MSSPESPLSQPRTPHSGDGITNPKLFPHPLIGLGIIPLSPVPTQLPVQPGRTDPSTLSDAFVSSPRRYTTGTSAALSLPNADCFTESDQEPLKPASREFVIVEGKENSHPSLNIQTASDDEEDPENLSLGPEIKKHTPSVSPGGYPFAPTGSLDKPLLPSAPNVARSPKVHFGACEKPSRSKISGIVPYGVPNSFRQLHSPGARSGSKSLSYRAPLYPDEVEIGSRKLSLVTMGSVTVLTPDTSSTTDTIRLAVPVVKLTLESKFPQDSDFPNSLGSSNQRQPFLSQAYPNLDNTQRRSQAFRIACCKVTRAFERPQPAFDQRPCFDED